MAERDFPVGEAMTQAMPQAMTEGADGGQGLFPKADPNRYRRPKFWFCLFLLVLLLAPILAANWIVFATSFFTTSGSARQMQILVLLYDLVLLLMLAMPFLSPISNDGQKGPIFRTNPQRLANKIAHSFRNFLFAGYFALTAFIYILFFYISEVIGINYNLADNDYDSMIEYIDFYNIMILIFFFYFGIDAGLLRIIKNVFNNFYIVAYIAALQNCKNTGFYKRIRTLRNLTALNSVRIQELIFVVPLVAIANQSAYKSAYQFFSHEIMYIEIYKIQNGIFFYPHHVLLPILVQIFSLSFGCGIVFLFMRVFPNTIYRPFFKWKQKV